MNTQVQRLYDVSSQGERLVIGLMSGTSLDGLDVALCRICGAGFRTQVTLLSFETVAYSDEFRNLVRSVFSLRNVDQQRLSGLHAFIGSTHGIMVLQCLERWGLSATEVDLVASHGQTVYHAPQRFTQDLSLPNSTLQIGDGDHVAVQTGIITVSDFRQKHVAAGGEGAPLAAYGDYLLYSSEEENRVLLNIGGIANFTFLPNRKVEAQAFSTDVGPGNTLMDQCVRKYFGKEMDIDAVIARSGTVRRDILGILLEDDFLGLSFPKTTGPEYFMLSKVEDLLISRGIDDVSSVDLLTTLCHFTVESIVSAIERVTESLSGVVVYVSGGGLHNPLVMELLHARLSTVQWKSFSEIGFNPDAKEAVLFAVLANETVAGNPFDTSGLMGAPSVCMGKISFPY